MAVKAFWLVQRTKRNVSQDLGNIESSLDFGIFERDCVTSLFRPLAFGVHHLI